MSGTKRRAYAYRRSALAAGMLLAGMLYLVACSSGSIIATLEVPVGNPTPVGVLPPSTAPRTAQSIIVTATVTPTLQPPPTVTSSINVGPPPVVPAGQLLRLTSLHMMTPTKGWATGSATLGIVSNTSLPAVGDIFYTQDGGTDWNLVSPDGVSSKAVDAAYFLDAANAWIVISTTVSLTATASPTGTVRATGDISPTPDISSTTMTTYRTADGGQTWQGGAAFSVAGKGLGILDFVDTQHGWLMIDLGGPARSEGIEILKTVDGGMSWRQVSLTTSSAGQQGLPYTCDSKGISFVDASTGWVTGHCPGGPLFFYRTDDGGQTWQVQPPAPPPGDAADLFSNCQCAVNPPLFVSSQFGVFALTISEANLGTYLYATDDGGKTWTSRELPVTLLFGGPDFFDVNDGVISDGQRIFVTNDGGQTWAQIGTLPAPSSNLIGGLDFIDANHGWVTDGRRLYATHDGSQTWITMVPVVAATTASQPAPLDVTLADDGKTIALQVGQRFVLELSQEYSWTVTVMDPIIVGPLVDVTIPQGAQGVYEAFRSGTTTLLVSGNPLCRQVQPPCAIPSRQFQVQLVVQ